MKLAVLALAAVYATYFGFATCIAHLGFRTYAYDLGTFDQGIWLAGHTSDFFVTVRGLHLLGDHVRLISFVLAPLYYVWDDVRALLVLQSVVIAAGAWFLCRIALRELPNRPWLVLALCAGYLLHPAVQNLNLDHAHPDAFATTLLLASVDFLRGGRIAAFCVAAVLAMMCKEDVPLVFAAMGVVLMLDPARRRFGFVLAAASTAYFLLCMLVILPHFNGIGFFRTSNGFLAGAGAHGTDPQWLMDRLWRPQSALYLFALGVPHLFLFLLSPLWIVPALPALAANLLSDANYMRSLIYHYQTSIVPFLSIATIDALARLARVSMRRPDTDPAAPPRAPRAVVAWTCRALVVLAPAALLAAAVAANVNDSKAPIHRADGIFEQWSMLRKNTKAAELRRVMADIPEDAVVSAHYALVPHLSHRRRIYMFPNPFRTSYWGVDGERSHDPEAVDYIVMRNLRGRQPATEVLQSLLKSNRFVRESGGVEYAVYRRVDRPPPGERASCGDWDGDGNVTIDDTRTIAEAIMSSDDCPARICDADGDGAVRYADVLRLGKRLRDSAAPLECPP